MPRRIAFNRLVQPGNPGLLRYNKQTAKLTDLDVLEIRHLLRCGKSQHEVRKIFEERGISISQPMICYIKNYQRYAHVA